MPLTQEMLKQKCNIRNRGMLKSNKSGVTGVYKNISKKWSAQIKINGKQINLGSFDRLYDAAKKRWDAEKKYNFTNCNTTSSAFLYINKGVS